MFIQEILISHGHRPGKAPSNAEKITNPSFNHLLIKAGNGFIPARFSNGNGS
jgi:hypothetical protein